MKSPQRRRFLRETLQTLGGIAALGSLAYPLMKSKNGGVLLRPPFALPEENFLNACSRCGQCITACSYQMLHLATLFSSKEAGTPYFVARAAPCEMCEDMPCVKACPTGALDKNATHINHAKMGLAVLLDQETCLNYQGLRCDVCYRVCPLIDKAITLERQHNPRSDKHAMFLPVVQSDACTGCGKCENACVLSESAIKVLPLELAKGKLGEHYRFGWQEKEREGKSLAPSDLIQLPIRGLEE